MTPHLVRLDRSTGALSGYALAVLALAACGPAVRQEATAPAAPTSDHVSAAAPEAHGCPDDAMELERDILYLGRNKPDGSAVADGDWETFVEEVVVPRFPEGFTVQEAVGHWRGNDGGIVRERTMVLTVLHPPGPGGDSLVTAIATAYRARFQQEASLREHSPVCSVLQRGAGN